VAKLYFYYAAMNAGKSTTLLQADFNYRERGMETMLWTARLDNRAGDGMIGSRIASEALSRGHEVCSPDPWVNGSRTKQGVALAYHPLEAGMRAVAKQVVAQVESFG